MIESHHITVVLSRAVQSLRKRPETAIYSVAASRESLEWLAPIVEYHFIVVPRMLDVAQHLTRAGPPAGDDFS